MNPDDVIRRLKAEVLDAFVVEFSGEWNLLTSFIELLVCGFYEVNLGEVVVEHRFCHSTDASPTVKRCILTR